MKNYKKYWIVNVFLIFSYLMIVYILSYINRNYLDENNKFLRIPRNLKIINLGSSHFSYGIKYPQSVRGFNFANPAQPFYYDLIILKKNLNKIQKNGVVILPVSIFSFYYILRENI